jgi:hypothetical protein
MENKNKKVMWLVLIVVVVICVWLYIKNKAKANTPFVNSGAVSVAGSAGTAVQGFPIHYGATGNPVKLMQQGLNGHYGSSLAEDGIYGPETKQVLEDLNFPDDVDFAAWSKIVGSNFTAQALNTAIIG